MGVIYLLFQEVLYEEPPCSEADDVIREDTIVLKLNGVPENMKRAQ